MSGSVATTGEPTAWPAAAFSATLRLVCVPAKLGTLFSIWSLSARLTIVVVAVLPSTMPSGSGLVNSKRIDSPSSSRASSIAVTVNDVDVAVRPIVTDDGAPL